MNKIGVRHEPNLTPWADAGQVLSLESSLVCEAEQAGRRNIAEVIPARRVSLNRNILGGAHSVNHHMLPFNFKPKVFENPRLIENVHQHRKIAFAQRFASFNPKGIESFSPGVRLAAP